MVDRDKSSRQETDSLECMHADGKSCSFVTRVTDFSSHACRSEEIFAKVAEKNKELYKFEKMLEETRE